MDESSHTTDEIWILANYHLDILRHRFPNYGCSLDEHPPYWVSVHADIDGEYTMVFMAIFSSNSIQITIPPFEQEQGSELSVILTIKYADPKFTDDTFSDMLRELESIAQRKGWPNFEEYMKDQNKAALLEQRKRRKRHSNRDGISRQRPTLRLRRKG